MSWPGEPPPRSPRLACRSARSSAWTATRCCSPRRGPIRPRSACGSTAPVARRRPAGGDRPGGTEAGGLQEISPAGGRARRHPGRGDHGDGQPHDDRARAIRPGAHGRPGQRRGPDRRAGRDAERAGPAPGPVRGGEPGNPQRAAAPLLARAGLGPAAGAARPVRRPARAAGARRPGRVPDLTVARRAGIRGAGRRRPGHPGPGPGVGAGGLARPGGPGARRPGRGAAGGRRAPPRPGHQPGRDPRLVVRRLPGRAGRAAPPGRVPRRGGRRPGHRLAAVRHPLHRALPRPPRRAAARYTSSPRCWPTPPG